MVFYLVKDASKWMSDFVFKSKDDAIVSQNWRLEEPSFDVSNDFPITIVKLDTQVRIMSEVMELSEEQLRGEIKRIKGLKKGGLR